jgi:hypothetical protein
LLLIFTTEKAEKTAEAINADGGSAIAVGGDITKNEDIENLVQRAVTFGGGKLHIIVNNAGYAWDDAIEKIQDKQWGRHSSEPVSSYLSLTNPRDNYHPSQYSTFQTYPRGSSVLHGQRRRAQINCQCLFNIWYLRQCRTS